MNLKKEHYSYILMLGHLCADMSLFALTAAMPFLVVQKGMSMTATAGLGFVLSLSNAIIQPILGAMADNKNRPWLMALGVLMSGIGIGLIGFAENYSTMIFLVAISSVGGAIFHPDGGRIANYVSGASKGKGVSNFSFGGNLAGFVGPVLMVFGISHFGMHGSAIVLLPTVIMAIWLFLLCGKFNQFVAEGQQEIRQATHQNEKTDDWKGFWCLTGVTVSRSAIMVCMNSFIPMFWLYILMQSEEVSGLITTVIALSGAIATFIGGRIADKLGFRKMIRVGLMALVPCMFILAITRSVLISLIVLVPAAVALNLAYSPSVVLGQKLLPNHIGFASGVTMGLASSIGGLFSPILGRVADTQGVDVVMWIMFAICVVAAVSTVILPEDPDLKVKNS